MDLNCLPSSVKFSVIWLSVDEATTTLAISRCRAFLYRSQLLLLQSCELFSLDLKLPIMRRSAAFPSSTSRRNASPEFGEQVERRSGPFRPTLTTAWCCLRFAWTITVSWTVSCVFTLIVHDWSARYPDINPVRHSPRNYRIKKFPRR